jgi:hypothetical protein
MNEDQGQSQDLEMESPTEEEYALEQKVIPFMGDELAAALTQSGGIFISLPGMCGALGLNTRGQLQRIQRTSELAIGLRRIPLQTKGGRQTLNCLRIDKLGLWLAGIETARVKSQFRAKLDAYHQKLAPVAIQIFLSMAGVPATSLSPANANQEMQALIAQIEHLTSVVVFLNEHMQGWMETTGQQIGAVSLKLDEAILAIESLADRQEDTEQKLEVVDTRTNRLTPAHKRSIQEYITTMVKLTEKLPVPLTYATIYGHLKTRFRISSYSEAPDERYSDMLAFLRDMLRRTGADAPEQDTLF